MEAHTFHLMSAKFQRVDASSREISSLVIQAIPTLPATSFLMEVCTDQIVKVLQDDKTLKFDSIVDENVPGLVAVVEYGEAFSLINALNIALWCQKNGATLILIQLPDPEYFNSFLETIITKILPKTKTKTKAKAKPAEKIIPVISKDHVSFDWSQLIVPTFFIPNQSVKQLLDDFRRNSSLIRFKITAFRASYRNGLAVPKILLSSLIEEMINHKNGDLSIEMLDELQGYLIQENVEHNLPQSFDFIKEKINHRTFPLGIALLNIIIRCAKSSRDQLTALRHLIVHFTRNLSWLSDAVHIAQEPVLKDIVIQLLVECLHNQESIQFPDVSQDCEWMIPLWCFLVESGVLSEPNRAIEWQNILSIAFAEGNLAVFCGVFKSAKDMKSQCITEIEVNDSLKAFSQLSFPSFDDLKLILSIGNVEDELESPFKAIIKRMIDHSVVSPDFNQLMRLLLHLKTLPEQFKDLSMQIITVIIPTLVFKMNSAEMRKWIKEGYAFIPRPSQMEWEDYLREASRDHTLLLQEILVILESLIEFNLTSPDVVIDLVTIYTDNHQILDAYQTFLEIASTDMMQKHWDSIKDAVFGKLSLKTFMISGQQFLKFSQSVAKGRWLDQAKVIADYIIGKFINHVFKPINQNDCTCDIFTYHDLLSYSSDKEFMGKVFQFCFRQFKIIDIFEDYPTLLGFLSSLSNAHDSIVISMLRLLQNSRLNFIPPETVQALKEIKEKYQELCDHQRLKLVDWKSLESILSNDRRVETLEKALQSGGKLLEAIRLTIVKIRSINKFIESQKPFLAHLKCFFPGTVRDIEERSQINFPIEEKHHLSLQTWSTRKTEVVDFINQYHKDDIDFFLHFSSLESSQASNSILFGYFMKKHAAEKDDEALNSRDVIRAVRDDLMKLCSIHDSYQRGKKMNMEQLLEISKELQLADRKPEREFNIICSYLYKDSTSSQRVNMIREKITKILDLVVLREALIPFFLGERNESGVALPRLEFLKFLCADPNKDEDYLNLVQLLKNMENSKVMEKWDAEKCQEMLSALLNCFADDVNHHQVLGILNLINNAAQCSKVWEFFLQRPDFISPEGLGYSNSLNDKLEDFLTELGGEDAKIVNNFCTVGHWVAILIHHLQTPFKQLIQSLLESTKIRNQLEATSDTQRFSQLLLANEHMDYIGDLMQYGLSSLDIVLSQLKSIQLFCIYHFDAETVELTLEYYDVKRNQTVILSKDELQDFQQRLEFVQREKNALTYDVPAFVGQLDAFRKKILLLHELFLLGHPKYNSKLYSLRCGGPKTRSRSKFTGTDLKLKELENLETELRMWEDKLNHVMKENPLMTLFTKEQAKNIAQVKSQHHLIYSLAHLFDESSRSVKKTIEKCLQAAQRLQISHDWVATFSAIINCLTFSANLRKELLLSAAAINDYQNCTRFICTSNGNSLMKCLTKVFARSSVPPMAVQLLWCYFNVTSNDLKEFLNRALSFPQMNFTLVRFDLLSLSQQQMVLKFMLEHQELKNLHCIENGNGILQSASWMPVINAEDHLGDFDYLSKIKDWTKSNQNNLCFHGPAGSGKTFHLRKWMHQSRAKGFVPHLISITEQFDWKRILQSIYNAFVSGEKVLLAFQINIGKFRDNDGEIKQWKRLVESINVLFFHLLVIRGFSFLNSEIIFNIPLTANCLIGLEFPDLAAHVEGPIGREDLFSFISREVPVLSTTFQFQDASSFALELSPEAVHVCKYLKAFDNGSIDKLYSHEGGEKDVMIVLDISGSMGGMPLNTCQKCLVNDILARRINSSDRVGLILFQSRVTQHIDLTSDKNQVVRAVQAATAGGGTHMWTAIAQGLSSLLRDSSSRRKVLIALTDGATEDAQTSVAGILRGIGEKVQTLFITIALSSSYEAPIRQCCIRDPKRDFIISADNGVAEIEKAWKDVGELLTVSQRIEKEGENIQLEECVSLLSKYMKIANVRNSWSRQHEIFWIRYMHRRCGILASSERFNKNQDLPKFGSTTMSIMLQEVDRALSSDFQIDWNDTLHEQMIYRRQQVADKNGKIVDDYSWSILCSNPGSRDPHWQARMRLLQSLKMNVPSLQDLNRPDRRVLDSYLAHGLSIPLSNVKAERSASGSYFDFELGSLPIINECQFVLTLDFVIKMLTINERIECRVPCIIEGETGVSKTALTRMLFTLKNGARRPTEFVSAILDYIANLEDSKEDSTILSLLQYLAEEWNLTSTEKINESWRNIDNLAETIAECELPYLSQVLLEAFRNDPSLDPLDAFTIEEIKEVSGLPSRAGSVLLWLLKELNRRSRSENKSYWAFFAVNVHASLTIDEISAIITTVSRRAGNALTLGEFLDSPAHLRANLCIFFDEINTLTYMGVLKEIIIDHTFCGQPLPSNVVIAAACNPVRKKLQVYDNRKEEHGLQWVSGHYQVHPLPGSLEQLKWDYGSLKPSQEREFIRQKMQLMSIQGLRFSSAQIKQYTEVVDEAQQITRSLAREHVEQMLKERYSDLSSHEFESRASSIVSLRDILRVFKLFKYLMACSDEIYFLCTGSTNRYSEDKIFQLLLLTIAVVYYLRMGVDQGNKDRDFRTKFRVALKERCGLHCDVESVINAVMKKLIDETLLEPGVAKSRGLTENVFMVFFCLLARIPLMIIGPPGSSKTLAVTTIIENARGEYSSSPVYRSAPSMVHFHYQCSRKSTSNQIQEVFERAIQRQAKADKEGTAHRSFVFMDEAGLPEEARESLKVLHYYLEDHMKVDAEVGFVAISNHVLDAAKTNRCAVLLRAPPDHEDLFNIASGCFGPSEMHQRIGTALQFSGDKDNGKLPISLTSSSTISLSRLLDTLCESFEACSKEISTKDSVISCVYDFIDFYGLRDFMHSIKLLGRLASADRIITSRHIVEVVERNFNGADKQMVQSLIKSFSSSFELTCSSSSFTSIKLQNPLSLLAKSLEEQKLLAKSLEEQKRYPFPVGRYILIIDTTSNDAILRILMKNLSFADQYPKLLKLSQFVEDGQAQQISIISQVRWGAEKGELTILSRTEPINESLYDLFNQHFRRFEDRTGSAVNVVYHTNIAIGAHSRRCQVSPGFQCIVHLTLDELQVAPAPFLNRFEKYRIHMSDALAYFMQTNMNNCFKNFHFLKRSIGIVFQHTQAFVHIVGISAFYGFGKNQTIESVILSVLIELKSVDHIIQLIQQNLYKISFQEAVQKDANITATELRELQQKNLTMQLLENSSTLKGSREEKILEVLVTQSLLHYTIDMLLRIAIPENILSKWSEFPVSVLNMLLVERKFFLNLKDISEDARKRIVITRTTPNIIRMQTQDEGFSIISFTKFNKETHFEELLKSLSLDRMDSCEINYHTIIFDLSQVQISQINFARSKVDELWEDLLKEKVALTFLLHTTNADLRAKHLYDVTFADDWHCSFVDGSISSDLSYSFLQVSYSTLNEIDGKALLSSALPHWLPDAMNALEKTILSAITSNGNEDQFLLQVLNYHNYGRTVKDIVFERFIQLFFSEAGGDGSIFKAEVQRAVERYWRVSQNISLLDSVQLHIQSMFTKFLQFFVFSLLEDISINQFQLENRLVLPDLVFDFLHKVEAPPIASLQTPLKLSMVLKLREEIGFPLFQSFYRMLEVMSNKILSSFNNCEDEDVWFQMINAFNTTLQQSQASDATAHLFLKHCWLVDDESFLIYIDNYAAMLFKDVSTSSLQLQFVRNWLKNQVKFYSMNGEGRIALLHLQGQWYREMLFSFVSAIEPISVLAPSEEAKTSLFDLCAEGENAGEILHDAIIEFCYATLLECQELSLFQQIMQTYTFFLFESKKRRFSKRSQLKYEGIVTFFLISSTLTEGMLMDAAGYISIRNLVAKQISAAERLGQSDISLPSLWKALPKATILKSAALTLLLQQRSERFTSSEIVWIINTLSTEEETFSDLNLAAIILDIALFSKTFSLKENLPIIKSIIDWIKLVGSLISFDEQLRVNRTPGVPYVPHWFINQVPQKSFNRLADITFCLVWKWLMQLHSAASISELLALVHECEMSFESDRNVQNLVTVSLTAIRLYILHKWADCILQNRSAFNNELDKSRFLAQLDFVQPMASWTEELAATLSSKAKQYKKNIVQYSLNKWKSSYCDGNKLILSWLNMIETRLRNTSENPLYFFQLKPYYSTKKIQSSSPLIEDSILSSFCRGSKSTVPWIKSRHLLHSFWIIPDLMEFYEWLSIELSSYSISLKVVKGTTIGDLLKRSISQSYGNKYCKLWNKIKVGYRSYLKALDGSERCNSFELSDGLSLWELVSVNHATDSHEGMLFQILKQMVQSYGKVIDVSLSASMTHTSRPNVSSLAMITAVNIETIDRLLDEDSSMGIVEKALEGTLTHQESFNLVQRMVWLEYVLSRDVKFSHSFPLLSHYVNYVKSLAPVISISSLKIRYCNFANEANAQNNTDLTSIGKSQLIQFFHSLDYTEIIALTQSLTMLQNSAPIDSPQTSIGDLLLQLSLHDRSNDLTSFAERCLAVSDKDLLNFILSLSSGELPRLIGFLNLQIQSEIYIFANKPLELKKAWTEEVDEALKELEGEGLANIASVKDMESLLVKHEILLSKRPSESLVSTLAGVFQSDLTMFKQFPLLKKLSDVMIKCSYTLLCGHYVSLRLKLRQWANHSNKTKSNKSWDWSIESAVRSSASLENRNAVNFSYLNPWFLSSEDDDHEETSRQEINRYYERCVKKIQKWYKRNKSLRSVQRKVGEATKAFQETDAKRTTEKGGRGGRAGRGRGRGQAQNKAIGIMANIAQEFQSYEPIINEIDSLLKDPNIRQQGKIDRLQTLLEEAIKMGASNTDGITLRSARALIAEFQERRQAALDSLDKILLHNPIEPEDLRRTLNGLLVLDVRDKKVDEAIKKLESILELKKKIAAALTTPPGLKRLKQLHNESVSLQLEEDRELVLLIEQLDRNDQLIRKRLSQRFNFPENISYNLSDANDAFDLQSTTTSTQSSMLQELLSKVNLQGGKSQQQKAIDTLLSKLEREPLSSFVHSKAILALGNSCPTHIDVFREDAEDFLANYFKIIQEKKHPTICSAVLLAVMRLTSSSKDVEFQVACLKHCDSPALRPWMSVTELALLSTNPSDATSPAAPSSSTIVGKPFANAVVDAAARWKDLQSLPNARPCSAIDNLMEMIGLNGVKQRVLDIYESIWMESKIPAASRVPRSYHFALLGNPGTGKTTVGKLLGKMLKELGIRSKNEFIDTTGEKLARMGADKAEQEINKAMDGVFFIDEAYALDPAKNVEGGAVAMQLLDVAESERERITLILAGYKNEIESKLFDYNDGFHRRFPHILVFDDYTDPELGQIFQSLCQQGNWKCSSDVVKLAARRVGRGRGHKTFGNAGAVRVCFERAYERALSRMKEQRNFKLEMVLEDVLGPPPTRENIPQLDRALEELDNVIGLETVKEKILNIVNLSLVNYHLELEGKEPRLISLNKVFLGNPGTGKTTVGKLYGRILRGLGFLSDGQCELKQPSDFLGSAVGETQKKTSALIARCKGKVLIIDEAYGLHGSSYGPEAVDTLVGLCHNSPGEDIAVIMIGYEKQIRRMFREMNPGLSSRFSLDDPFVFEDYNDDDLRRIAMKYVKDSGLTIPRETREALVKAISRQRFAPNFGNARTVVTMISRGKERISARDPRSTTLTLEDFGIESKKSSNPFELLQGMYKTDHIKQELIALQALLNQSERDGRDARQYLKNYIFIGNPGTGKSTVARLMATILFDFGLLGRNHVVTRSGLDLQGSYIGQTKDKVNEAMEEAQGGVLFIDEAYTLGGREGGGTVFAQEAVDQLVALLTTPEHLHNTVVILAGYPEAMEQMMQSSNEGLVSRCTGRMIFPNWDGRDCIEFLRQECDKENMTLEVAAINAFSKEFDVLSKRRDWANARDCVSTLKHLYQARALRGPRDFVYIIDDAEYAIAQLRLSRPVNAVVENSRGKPLGIVHTAIGNITSPVPAVQRKRAREEVKEEEASAEIEEIVMEVDDGTSNGDDLDPVYAALLIACREAGYDDSHERRCELVPLLEIVEQGGDFPTDIITIVIEKTKLSERAVTKILRPQVYRVLEGMRNAVRAEEELREELKRLKKKARKAKERELQQQREKLRRIGVCPMGYTWHRCGEGWRCAGGSHYVTDSQLINMCTIE